MSIAIWRLISNLWKSLKPVYALAACTAMKCIHWNLTINYFYVLASYGE